MKRITFQQLHQQHNLFPENTNFHLVHSLDRKTKDWKFMGYRCMKCGVTFKRASTVPNHLESCRYYLPKRKDVTEQESINIVTVDGKPWQPIDFNQKFSSENE